MLAQTARTAAVIPRVFDIVFTNDAGGTPGDDDFNADAFLDGVADLERAGVTWVQVGVPGDSLAHTLETIERFGSTVIAPS